MPYKDLTFLLFAKDMNVKESFARVSASADGMSAGVKGALGGMGIAVAGAAVAYAAHSVNMAASFQQATTRIITDGGGAGESIDKLQSVITDAGVKTGTSMDTATKAMYKLSSAGFTLKNGGGAALIAALEGAKIGGADAVVVADALSTTMTDFGYSGADAAKVMSMLTATVATGKTNLNDLASSLHSVLPNAQAAGLGLQEVLAAVGTMTAEGVSAEQSTQNLANAISALQAPSLVSQHAMQGIGVSALDVAKNLGKRGLAATYDDLLTHMAKSSKAGLVVVKSFADSAQAGYAMKTELAGMPPTLRALAESFQAGHLTSKQWAADLKPYPAVVANLGKQFATTVKHSTGFSDALKSGEGPIRTNAEQLEKMLGGATGLSVALHLTGDHMQAFVANTKSITAATTEAGGHVRGWGEQQKTFNQTMDQASSSIDALSTAFGKQLMPGIQAVVSVIPGVVNWLLDAQHAVRGFDISVLESVKSLLQWESNIRDAGAHVIEGLVSGIESGAKDVQGAVAWISSLIPSGVRKFLNINSPSKVMIPIGAGVGEGLAVGILGSANQVQSASNRLSTMVIGMFEQKKGGISSWAEDSALRTIRSGTDALISEATRRAAIGKQLVAAEKTLTRDLAAQRKLRDSNVIGATVQAGDVTQFASAGAMVGGLSALVARTNRFRADLTQLVKKGIDQDTFKQLIAAGVNGGGLQAADQLLANPSDFKQIVALQRQLAASAGSLGSLAGNYEYAPTIARDRARVATLKGTQQVETWRMQKTAAGMLSALSRETHVHIHIAGTFAGSQTQLAKSVVDAIRQAVKQGHLPKSVLTAL